MGSVQLQIVPCSSLYFFSRSTGPFQCLVNVSHRVLICCTCHFQSFSLFLYFGSSVCKSLQCLISTLTEGGGGGQVFRLTCSVVLWGGRSTANKSALAVCGPHRVCPRSWRVWGVLAVYGPHWVCPSSQRPVLSGSTLLRLQGALQGTVQSRPWVSCTSQV